MKAHRTTDVDLQGHETTEAWIHPASLESVAHVMAQPETDDGRSEFVWVRLPCGDLILGVFPRGDTYFAVEIDAAYPGDSN